MHKLKRGHIELRCKAKLIEANVPESIVLNAEKILRRARRTTFIDSFIAGLKNPFFSFLFGGISVGIFINFVTSIALEKLGTSSKYYVLIGLLLLIVILAVGNYLWLLVRNREMKVH
jgi:hypothetical protein